MNIFQIVMLTGAGLLALSVFWPNIKGLLVQLKPNKVKPYIPAINHPSPNAKADSSLVEIIRCWEHLKVSCKKANLREACGELDKIFPLFLPEVDNQPAVDEEVRNV